jgi:hypothetical protein
MDISYAYRKILSAQCVRNVFHPIEEINNPEVEAWISKSKHELNRFAQYVISLHTFEKEKPNYHTCQAIHESMNGCSVSIVFSLFNIFALLTKTRASFFDQSIRDYFMKGQKLTFEESYLLSFFWHEPVLSMNSLGYSADQILKIYSTKDGIGFNVLTSNENSDLDQPEKEEITDSLKFYTFHLFQLLSTIELVANLLIPGTTQSKTTSYLPIENYHVLYNIYEDILKKIDTAT